MTVQTPAVNPPLMVAPRALQPRAGRACRVISSPTGVELALGGTPRATPALAFASVGLLGAAALGASSTLLLALLAGALLLGSLRHAGGPVACRLVTHAASGTWVLLGCTAGEVLAGGASADLCLVLQPRPRGQALLALRHGDREIALGSAGRLSTEDLATVRRFAALSGLRLGERAR